MSTNDRVVFSKDTIDFIKQCYTHLKQSRHGVWAFADLSDMVWNSKLHSKNKELFFNIIHDAIAYELVSYEDILSLLELKNDFFEFYNRFINKINTSQEYINFLETRINKLESRFGLVWKDQEEQLLKVINEKEIILGTGKFKLNDKYTFVTTSKEQKQKIIKDNNNKEFKIIRKRGDSFLYYCKELDKLFLIYSVKSHIKVYSFVENNYTKYYPILMSKGKTYGYGDNRPNLILEGDNYHTLQLLQYTHRNKIDAIYIDPPYNTGNHDFKYNDSYVGSDDGSRHSKWLSFMEKRLYLSKSLLTENGCIFISIDENELANLKLLCDNIFGQHNYVENFIWVKNSTKNQSKTSSCNHEYILCYAKNKSMLENQDDVFVCQKPGFDDVMTLYKDMKSQGRSSVEIQTSIRNLYKGRDELKGIKQYKHVDKDGIYREGDTSAPGGNGATYTVMHPNGQACTSPAGGWRYAYGTMQKHIAKNLISFGTDEKKVPQFKRYLDTVDMETVKSVIINNDEGDNEITNIFNAKVFNNPKPISLISYMLNMVTPADGLVLDFFAGSGTTGHAVLALNKEDGGNRKFILCTNNEENICEDVTYARFERLNNPTKYNLEIDNLEHGLNYLQVQHVSDLDLENADDAGNFEFIKHINNVKYSATKILHEDEFFYITDTYAVFKKLDANKQLEYCNLVDLALSHNVFRLILLSSDLLEFNIFKQIINTHIGELGNHDLCEKISYGLMSKDYIEDMMTYINNEDAVNVEDYSNDGLDNNGDIV